MQGKIILQDVGVKFVTKHRRNGAAAETEVLRDVNLVVKEGEFISLVGPSGCGKSTILNLIAGLWNPEDGILNGSIQVNHGSPRRPVGYVLQRDTLFPWRSLLQNVTFGLELQQLDKQERERRAREWIKRVRLSGFEDYFPHQLSGGMRQRANIIRVLAYDPEIVLMDEPLGALDAHTRMVIQQETLDLWTGSGKTVVLVTHDLEEAILLSSRVVLLGHRPAAVKSSYSIDLPYPRSIIDLKMAQQFRSIHGELWAKFSQDLREVQV